jgi:acetyl esterase/lipase
MVNLNNAQPGLKYFILDYKGNSGRLTEKQQQMTITRFTFLLIVALVMAPPLYIPVSADVSTAATTLPAPTVISIWPGLAPGETKSGTGDAAASGGVTRVSDVFTPQLFVFTPNGGGHKRPAVLVFPGGGYGFLSQDLEGTEIASWLNGLGYVAIVLDYRVPNNREGALQDAQRSISLVRGRAKDWGIDPTRIGVLGFSAGGHLAARATVSYGSTTYAAVDKYDKISNRPDFALLIYPAYLIDSSKNVSPNVTPHAGMPPIFLTQTKDDPFLDAPEYFKALKDAGDQASLLIYDAGGHGYGLRLPETAEAHEWSDWAAVWLKSQLGD